MQLVHHIMLRVTDLERSLKFYTEILGMKKLAQRDFPEGRFTIAFVGYCEEDEGALIELTHNWDTDKYEIGNGFGHIAIKVTDVYKMCEDIRNKGGVITREPGPMKYGTVVLAFVKDPDGYSIELLQ